MNKIKEILGIFKLKCKYAHLVSLIVLLILAGVSLSSVFSEKGIFSRTEDAGAKYNEAKAREVLETVLLADGQYEKNINPDYNQDDFLDALIKSEIQGSDIKGDVAIIGEWAFELDRSVPKIGRHLGRADKLVFPKVTVSEPVLATDYRTSSFTAKAIEDKKGISKIELWIEGKRIETHTQEYSNIKTEITKNFTVNKNGTYTVKVYGDLMASETVEVTGIVPSVEFTPNGSTEWKKQHTTKVTVEETAETITGMKYVWIKDDGVNEPAISAFTQNCTNDGIITGGDDTMTGTYYLWILLTTNTGKTNICGSNGFNFDNEGPNLELSYTPTSKTSFNIVIDWTDNAWEECYIVVKGDSQTIFEGLITEKHKELPFDCGNMTDNYNLYCEITDRCGNNSKVSGTASTWVHLWSVGGAKLKETRWYFDFENSEKELTLTESTRLTLPVTFLGPHRRKSACWFLWKKRVNNTLVGFRKIEGQLGARRYNSENT